MADPTFQAALKLLARRDYFRSELVARLQGKGFADDSIAAAVDRCAAAGFFDDRRLARRFVELRAVPRGWSERRLAAELERRGADPELAQEMAALEPAIAGQALATALRRIEARYPARWWHSWQRRAKMLGALINRGFTADDAVSAVADLAAAREQQEGPDPDPGFENVEDMT